MTAAKRYRSTSATLPPTPTSPSPAQDGRRIVHGLHKIDSCRQLSKMVYVDWRRTKRLLTLRLSRRCEKWLPPHGPVEAEEKMSEMSIICGPCHEALGHGLGVPEQEGADGGDDA